MVQYLTSSYHFRRVAPPPFCHGADERAPAEERRAGTVTLILLRSPGFRMLPVQWGGADHRLSGEMVNVNSLLLEVFCFFSLSPLACQETCY